MNILEKILNVKRQEIQQIKDLEFGDVVGQTRSLKDALSKPGISIIAEIKMKSPSEGEIFPNADPTHIAKGYESAGAAAISVLTDKSFFGGSLNILNSVRNAVSIPVNGVLYSAITLNFGIGFLALGIISASLVRFTGYLIPAVLFSLGCALGKFLILTTYPRLTTILVFLN